MQQAYHDKRGPIEHFSWGRFVICGKEHAYSAGTQIGAGADIRIIGEEVTHWTERKDHLLTESMIAGVFDQEIEILIIGAGAIGAVSCPKSVEESILRRGIKEVIVQETPKACQTYNEMFHKGRKVAMLAHGTC